MSDLNDRYLPPIQRARFAALNSYLFGAIGVSKERVGTFENLVKLANDLYEAGIEYRGNPVAAIDEVWGYISALSKSARKKLRKKNIHKIEYDLKGYRGAQQRAKRDSARFYYEEETAARKARDVKLLFDIKDKKRSKAKIKSPTVEMKNDFYKSWDWRTNRMAALKKFGRACQCCGAEPGMKDASGKPVRIVVDHIKPISKHWNLRLDINNLQILCDECNMGKGNWDETDFRPDDLSNSEDIALDVLASMEPANGRAA